MSEQHERLLRRAYEAFNARDIEGALATMHPEVDWPNAMEGGRVRGHAEVRAYWERQWGSLDSRVRPLHIEQDAAGRVVATVHQLVRNLAGNVVSDETVEHRFSIADGLIERMDILDHWTIRSAGEKDIASVLDLWIVAGSVPSVSDSPDGLARLLAADSQALLVAELDGVLVGSLIAAWDGWRGSFYRLAVSPEHRRKGLATMLLREGERRLCKRGALRLTAIVADDEAGAMGFWRAVGYQRQPQRARFVRHIDLALGDDEMGDAPGRWMSTRRVHD
jgi:ribosomal protein S18 acetylase RimI-like enzyme